VSCLRLSVLALLAVAGCSLDEYECPDSAHCRRGAAQGSCAAAPGGAHYCAFADGTCANGERWDETAGGGFSKVCVGDPPNGGGNHDLGVGQDGARSPVPTWRSIRSRRA
jgi:hypothetical protein